MAGSLQAGAVVYAKDVERLGAFYTQVAGLYVTHTEDDHVVLESPGFQLVVVAIPAHIAASITIAVPPRIREAAAVKLVLPVASIAAARLLASQLGGSIQPAEREWIFQDSRVCDGHDPEGNVVQLREYGHRT